MAPETYSECYLRKSRLCLNAGEGKPPPSALAPVEARLPWGPSTHHPCISCGAPQTRTPGSQPPPSSKNPYEVLGLPPGPWAWMSGILYGQMSAFLEEPPLTSHPPKGVRERA